MPLLFHQPPCYVFFTPDCPVNYECGLICNPNIGTYEWWPWGSWATGWRNITGNPFYSCADPLGCDPGYIAMHRNNDCWGDAVITDFTAPTTSGAVKILTYKRNAIGANSGDLIRFRLSNAYYNYGNCINNYEGSSSQLYDDDVFGTPGIKTVAKCFMDDGSQLGIYPKVTIPTPNSNLQVHLDQIEVVEYPAPFTKVEYFDECCQDVDAVLDICFNGKNQACPMARLDWYVNGVFVQSSDTYHYQDYVCGFSEVTAKLVLLTDIQDVSSCTLPEYKFQFQTLKEDCCCEDYLYNLGDQIQCDMTTSPPTFCPPTGTWTTDKIEWDLNCDGTPYELTTFGPGGCYQPTLPSGTYSLCMKLTRYTPFEDTCSITLYKSFEVEPNCEDFYQTVDCSDVYIDFSNPLNITVNTTSDILPTDQIDIDIDCDGNDDTDIAGNYPKIFSVSCGWHCLNYTISRTMPDGSVCDTTCTKEIYVPCDFGGHSCLQFDGVDDRISIANPLLDNIGNGDFTFEAKIQAPAAGQNAHPTLVSNRVGGNGAMFFLHDLWSTCTTNKMLAVQLDGVNYFICDNNGIDLLDNVCHHLAISRQGDTISFYIDGSLIGTDIITSSTNTTTGSGVTIGYDNPTGSEFLGMISDVRVWNIARSQSDIVSNMNTSLTPQTGLVANWPLHEGSGQIISDVTNTNNGLLGLNASIEPEDPSWGADCCDVICPQCNNTNDDCCEECAASADFNFSVNGGRHWVFDFNPSVSLAGNCTVLSYLWDFGDGYATTQSSPTHSFVVPWTWDPPTFCKNFTVCLTVKYQAPDGEICFVEVCKTVKACNFIELELPDPIDIDFLIGEKIDGTINFPFFPIGDISEVDAITWTWGDGTESQSVGLNTTFHEYADEGKYEVCMSVIRYINEDGDFKELGKVCKEIKTDTIDNINNITPPEYDYYINPNPTKDISNISFANPVIEGKLELYNMTGQLMTSIELDNKQFLSLDMSNYPIGMYLVVVRRDGYIIPHKIIKE